MSAAVSGLNPAAAPEAPLRVDPPSSSGATAPMPAMAIPALSPAQRLNLSRDRLRAALFPPPPVKPPASAGWMAHQFASLKALPGVDIVIEAAQAWWHRHPLRTASAMAGEASKVAIKPVAVRHPYALVLVAAAAGMLIASLRPWRWALRSALFAGLLPQMLSTVITKLPVESWVAMLNSALARNPAAAASAAPPAGDRQAGP